MGAPLTTDVPPARDQRDHFARVIPQWSNIGPPMRPWQDDTALMQRCIDDLSEGAHAVLLGLTPEIVACRWPRATRLLALDHSAAMMAALWAPSVAPAGAHAVLADWRAMPLRSQSLDFVAGDGCYIVLDHPEGYAALTREVHRVLRPGGRFVIRVFVRPDVAESIEDIGVAVGRGEVGSVHALKLRLLAARHAHLEQGVRLDDVWRAWKTLPDPPASLRDRPGWTRGELATLEAYQGMDVRYVLPAANEFRLSVGACFTELACLHGRDELGSRSPTFVLAPR